MGIVRAVKNVTGGYSSSQKKVREITANDDDMPMRSTMQVLAELTYDDSDCFMIMDVLDKRLNDKGKYWRHVHKALLVLDYLVHYGSDEVITWCQQNLYIVKTLREFHYRDDSGREVGHDIRERARYLTSLIMDRSRLEEERNRRGGRRGRPRRYHADDDEYSQPPRQPPRPNYDMANGEDDELQRALELSKQTAAQEEERRRMAGCQDNNDLQTAYCMGQQNEMDMMFAQQRAAQEQAALQQQQADYYAQQQQAQAEAQRLYDMQQQMLMLQQQRQQQQQQLQQQQLQQQLQQQQMQQQQMQQLSQPQQQLQPLKTGSNNPFAMMNQQSTTTSPSLPSSPQKLETTATGSLQRLHRQSTFDRDHMDRLDQILSLDAPMDTFGNTGSAMMPAQHTANTGFVNSSGHGLEAMLTARRTGSCTTNPFAATGSSQPQYTGIVSTQMQPAHTGFGFGNANRSSTNLIDL